MDLISSLFSGMLSKITPILIFLLVFSVAANYRQANRIDELQISKALLTEKLDSVVNENIQLSKMIDKATQERDLNQALVDMLNKQAHDLHKKALATQAEVRTVIKHDQCSHAAIPDVAVERMREQYQGGNAVQNDRTKTASKPD